jgi:hypothetical protein
MKPRVLIFDENEDLSITLKEIIDKHGHLRASSVTSPRSLHKHILMCEIESWDESSHLDLTS